MDIKNIKNIIENNLCKDRLIYSVSERPGRFYNTIFNKINITGQEMYNVEEAYAENISKFILNHIHNTLFIKSNPVNIFRVNHMLKDLEYIILSPVSKINNFYEILNKSNYILKTQIITVDDISDREPVILGSDFHKSIDVDYNLNIRKNENNLSYDIEIYYSMYFNKINCSEFSSLWM